MSDKHKLEIMSLKEELHKSNEELKELRLELKRIGNSDQMSECLNKSHQSNTNSDDLESVETISISEKVISFSNNGLILISIQSLHRISEAINISDFDVR